MANPGGCFFFTGLAIDGEIACELRVVPPWLEFVIIVVQEKNDTQTCHSGESRNLSLFFN